MTLLGWSQATYISEAQDVISSRTRYGSPWESILVLVTFGLHRDVRELRGSSGIRRLKIGPLTEIVWDDLCVSPCQLPCLGSPPFPRQQMTPFVVQHWKAYSESPREGSTGVVAERKRMTLQDTHWKKNILSKRASMIAWVITLHKCNNIKFKFHCCMWVQCWFLCHQHHIPAVQWWKQL